MNVRRATKAAAAANTSANTAAPDDTHPGRFPQSTAATPTIPAAPPTPPTHQSSLVPVPLPQVTSRARRELAPKVSIVDATTGRGRCRLSGQGERGRREIV